MRLPLGSFVLLSILAVTAVTPLQAQERAVTYVLPDGPDVLQAKLSGPVPVNFSSVVCDSLVDPSCQVLPGTYQLQTFDRSWRATKSTVVIAPGSSSPDADEPDARRPAPPANVRFEFYSTFAGALSWDRAATPALRYEVRRDGVTVVPSTFGINFQEREARLLDRDHLYEVIAIAPDGSRSEPTRYFLESFRENPDPLGNPAPLPDEADRLAAPTNLRFTFYSTFSGALSWDRPATPSLRYEVRRNGATVIESTDGINYQERFAPFPTARQVYEVIAIAPDGRRSAPSRLTIEDNEQTTDSGPARPPVGEPAGPRPDAPTNLRFEYYSSVGGALFWDRAATPGVVYDVTRDGVTLIAASAGTNYKDRLTGLFDSRRVYEVVAVAPDGARSEPARFVHDPATAPVAGTLPSATLPTVGDDGFVSWPFESISGGGLFVRVSTHTRLPRAASGRQPRMNDMVHANGRLYVLVEEDGLIYDVTDGDEPTVWFDVAAAIRASTGRALDTTNRFHGGLRSAAFHPDFLENGLLYTSLMEERPADPSGHVYLSDVEGGIAADSVLVEWTVDPRSMVVDTASHREVFRVGVPEYDHPIKQIEFDPSAREGDADHGLLYIGHGDGSIASTTARGGRRDDALGKVLRIDPRASNGAPYSVPADNPFVGDDSMIDEAYSIGHRNPHHLSFAEDGVLLVADVGRDNVDEINRVVAGGDYGWAEREGAYVQLPSGGILDGIAPLPADDASNGYVYPVAAYGHPGRVGESFVTRAIVGGPIVRSGGGGDPVYLYAEFARTGVLLYSRMRDVRAARTTGDPRYLTYAQTRRVQIRVGGDLLTPDVFRRSMKEIVAADPGYDGSDRVDLRLGTDGTGRLYIMNKRNGVIYRASLESSP